MFPVIKSHPIMLWSGGLQRLPQTYVDGIVRWQRCGGHGLTGGGRSLHLSLSYPTSVCVPLPSSPREVSHRDLTTGLCLTLHTTTEGPRTVTFHTMRQSRSFSLRLIPSGVCYSGRVSDQHAAHSKLPLPDLLDSCPVVTITKNHKPKGLKRRTVVLQL